MSFSLKYPTSFSPLNCGLLRRMRVGLAMICTLKMGTTAVSPKDIIFSSASPDVTFGNLVSSFGLGSGVDTAGRSVVPWLAACARWGTDLPTSLSRFIGSEGVRSVLLVACDSGFGCVAGTSLDLYTSGTTSGTVGVGMGAAL